MSNLPDMMQPSIWVALTKWSRKEPEWGFEPGSAEYKATALPFELSSIDRDDKLQNVDIVSVRGLGYGKGGGGWKSGFNDCLQQ